jgi:hypothetical protein
VGTTAEIVTVFAVSAIAVRVYALRDWLQRMDSYPAEDDKPTGDDACRTMEQPKTKLSFCPVCNQPARRSSDEQRQAARLQIGTSPSE